MSCTENARAHDTPSRANAKSNGNAFCFGVTTHNNIADSGILIIPEISRYWRAVLLVPVLILYSIYRSILIFVNVPLIPILHGNAILRCIE